MLSRKRIGDQRDDHAGDRRGPHRDDHGIDQPAEHVHRIKGVGVIRKQRRKRFPAEKPGRIGDEFFLRFQRYVENEEQRVNHEQRHNDEYRRAQNTHAYRLLAQFFDLFQLSASFRLKRKLNASMIAVTKIEK